MKQLIDQRNIAEAELEKIVNQTRRAEKKKAAEDANRTDLNLTEFQTAEQTAKRGLQILEEEQQFKSSTKRELKTLKDETEKFQVRARKALIQRKQEISGINNDVRLLVQRVMRVREGLKKYDVLPGRMLYEDMENLLKNLGRLGRQISGIN